MKSGDDVIRKIHDLLATQSLGVLATSLAGQPYTSLVAFAASTDRWTFVRRFEGTAQPDPASEVWVKVLAQAAFATNLTADQDLPIRYDFGPDPYAWFKPPSK